MGCPPTSNFVGTVPLVLPLSLRPCLLCGWYTVEDTGGDVREAAADADGDNPDPFLHRFSLRISRASLGFALSLSNVTPGTAIPSVSIEGQIPDELALRCCS